MNTFLKIILYILLFYCIFLVIAITIRKIIQKRLRKLFIKSIQIFNNNNIEYWVDFGTLLGIHREKDIIIGDNDCDICIWEKDQDRVRLVLQNFCDSDNSVYFEEYDWGAFRIFYDKVFMDIYKCKIDSNQNVVKIPSARDTPKNLLVGFEIVNLPFYNTKVKLRQPEKWEELLESRYTKSWKTFLHKWYLGYYALENVKLS